MIKWLGGHVPVLVPAANSIFCIVKKPYFAARAKSVDAIVLGLLLLVASACITPREKRQMQDDLFKAQKRILQLEQALVSTESTGNSANKRLASTQTLLDRVDLEMQKLRGEIDALRVGVITGQLPGSNPQEGSIAQSLSVLSERLDAVEESQKEMLDSIRKSGVKSPKKSKKRNDIKSVSGLKDAFDDKRYSHVVSDAPALIKKVRGEDRDHAMFLLAESMFKLGKTRDAALKFNDLIEVKPSKRYLPMAKARMGDCFRMLGDAQTARLYYEEVIKDFPQSDEAEAAKEQLSKLK